MCRGSGGSMSYASVPASGYVVRSGALIAWRLPDAGAPHVRAADEHFAQEIVGDAAEELHDEQEEDDAAGGEPPAGAARNGFVEQMRLC